MHSALWHSSSRTTGMFTWTFSLGITRLYPTSNIIPISQNHMGVSKNNGTPKSSILIGFSIINHPFWGPTPIFGNTHIHVSICGIFHSAFTTPTHPYWLKTPQPASISPPGRRMNLHLSQLHGFGKNQATTVYNVDTCPAFFLAVKNKPGGNWSVCVLFSYFFAK